LKEKLRKVGNVFLNYSEISAQEAAYGVLGIPLTNSSRDTIFIPTGLPEERVVLVKSEAELQKLPNDSEDIAVSGTLDHYIKRPENLEGISLAEFAAKYTFTTSARRKPKQNETGNDSVLECEVSPINDMDSKLKVYKLLGNSGYVHERRYPRIIRFRRFREKEDEANYFREQLMLYYPWRDELSELIDIDVKSVYNKLRGQIDKIRLQYESMNLEISVEEMLENEDSQNCSDQEFKAMDGGKYETDIMHEFIGKDESEAVRIPSVSEIGNEDYQKLIISLNSKQKQYAFHVLDSLANNRTIREFLFGGAGR
jgi:hypothetical protein